MITHCKSNLWSGTFKQNIQVFIIPQLYSQPSTTIHPIVATKVPLLEPLEDRQLDPRQWTHEEDLPPVFFAEKNGGKKPTPRKHGWSSPTPWNKAGARPAIKPLFLRGVRWPMIVEAANSSSKRYHFSTCSRSDFESVSFFGKWVADLYFIKLQWLTLSPILP